MTDTRHTDMMKLQEGIAAILGCLTPEERIELIQHLSRRFNVGRTPPISAFIPTHYTLEEGGVWYTYAIRPTPNDTPFHAVRYAPGIEWDVVNGWRPTVSRWVVESQLDELKGLQRREIANVLKILKDYRERI